MRVFKILTAEANIKEIKKDIIKTGKRLYKRGLTSGASGNISFREGDKFFVTVSGACLGELKETQILLVDSDGNIAETSELKPSTETFMHAEIYKKRPDINCIIHAHPPYSTALAVAEDYKFLPILAEPTVFLGEVRCVNYKMPSSKTLAEEVANSLKENNAVLMSNHGAAVCGTGLKETFYKLETLEFYSRVYLLSGTAGKRKELNEEEVTELINLRNSIT